MDFSLQNNQLLLFDVQLPRVCKIISFENGLTDFFVLVFVIVRTGFYENPPDKSEIRMVFLMISPFREKHKTINA